MEAEFRTESRRRGRRSTDEGHDDEGRRRDTLVIQFPGFDPALRDLLADMIPGRALLRILRDLPEDVVQHSRNARRERLLALRSLVDALIEDAERPVTRPRRAREVEIE